MDKDIEKWGADFSLSDHQVSRIKEACYYYVCAVREMREASLPSDKETQKEIERLQKALDGLGPVSIERLDRLLVGRRTGTVESMMSLLKTLCSKADDIYKLTAAKGGKPERIEGRRSLAFLVARAMEDVGVMPTTTPNTGAFDRLLHITFEEAGFYDSDDPAESDKDLKSVRDFAVDKVKASPLDVTPLD